MDNSKDVYNQEVYSDLLDGIVANGILSRASDIHFDPSRETFDVRYRVDGLLYPVKQLSRDLQDAITSRLKVLCKLDITEHRLPQDGHFEFSHLDKIYNIRVSTFPSLYGEAIVLRIFGREESLIRLESLGLEPDQLQIVNMLINSHSGMVIITGPTGSGKTTFLYSVLHVLNKPEKNIMTLEDPIEFQMANLRQTQIREHLGFTFAKAMRSVIRQDPDVVMLGEIRDSDTAQMAVQAALTGIMIFSTFHTFDVPALITRLSEMGISYSVIAQIVKGVVSVRLVRRICDNCKQEYPAGDREKTVLGLEGNTVLYKGRGCDLCRNKGYLGRTGIFEVVYFDDDMKASIIEKKPVSFMYELLRRKNVKRLKDLAREKVLKGLTSFDEVFRVIALAS